MTWFVGDFFSLVKLHAFLRVKRLSQQFRVFVDCAITIKVLSDLQGSLNII